MILTDDEINALLNSENLMGKGWPTVFARAVESAVIAKLAAGVSVQPSYYQWRDESDKVQHTEIYKPDQLNTAIAAAQVQMNERCAKLVESLMDEQEPWMNGDDIRSLIGATL